MWPGPCWSRPLILTILPPVPWLPQCLRLDHSLPLPSARPIHSAGLSWDVIPLRSLAWPSFSSNECWPQDCLLLTCSPLGQVQGIYTSVPEHMWRSNNYTQTRSRTRESPSWLQSPLGLNLQLIAAIRNLCGTPPEDTDGPTQRVLVAWVEPLRHDTEDPYLSLFNDELIKKSLLGTCW